MEYMQGVDTRDTPGLLRADRVFRLAGMLTVALLLVTAGLLVADVSTWRPVFTFAHVAALVALLPLAVVLLRHGFRQARLAGRPGVVGVVRRYPVVTLLLAVVVVAVVLSLANFEDGNRLVRRTANLTTVGITLALVGRYMVWAGRARKSRG